LNTITFQGQKLVGRKRVCFLNSEKSRDAVGADRQMGGGLKEQLLKEGLSKEKILVKA